MSKKIKLLVLPGDGIGIDTINAVLPLFEKLSLPFELSFGEIGWECWKKYGAPIPKETWEKIKIADSVLLGAITSKPEKEAKEELTDKLKTKDLKYVSPIVQLRQKLKLFANVRPVFDINNDKFNLCVIRENTEGLYSGLDYNYIPEEYKSALFQKGFSKQQLDEANCTIRLQTRTGLTRIYRFAFEHAKCNGFKKVTLADKPNVLRQSSILCREIFEDISSNYPSIEAEILNVDAVGLWLVRRPEKFGVIVAENMFGDILSDVGAGVMGGLGFAPSANMNSKFAYFEPVHGSAPNMKRNRANPCAVFLSVKLLLERYSFFEEANRLLRAIQKIIKEKGYVTYDLGGNATTSEMAKAITEAY